uniref:Uncharacterized protein n=1 Tax=Rhizophora mucronata TaxID=61149 RepID=A0A2P2KR49_RHIMU
MVTNLCSCEHIINYFVDYVQHVTVFNKCSDTYGNVDLKKLLLFCSFCPLFSSSWN